jgi:hypothetical protein
MDMGGGKIEGKFQKARTTVYAEISGLCCEKRKR